MTLSGGCLQFDVDNGNRQGPNGFTYVGGTLVPTTANVTWPEFLPKHAEDVLVVRATGNAALNAFSTAGASYRFGGTAYVTNNYTGDDYNCVQLTKPHAVGGRGAIYAKKFDFDNAANLSTTGALKLDLDTIGFKSFNRSTWHTSVESFNGITFRLFAGDATVNSGLCWFFHGLIDVDTDDCFMGVPRKLPAQKFYPVSNPGFRVRGGGEFELAISSNIWSPIYPCIEICEGATLSLTSSDYPYLRVGKLKMGRNATLNVSGKIVRLENVCSVAEIDPTAKICFTMSATPAAMVRYGLLDVGVGGDVSSVDLAVSGIADEWHIEKSGSVAWLTDGKDPEVPMDTTKGDWYWTGAEDGNWNNPRNWNLNKNNTDGTKYPTSGNIVFAGTKGLCVTNSTGAELVLSSITFANGSGPCVISGDPIRLTQPYVYSSSSPLVTKSLNKVGVTFDTVLSSTSETAFYAGVTCSHYTFLKGLNVPNCPFFFGGEMRLGGASVWRSVSPHVVYNSDGTSGYPTSLTLQDGATVTVTGQSTNIVNEVVNTIGKNAKYAFTGGTYRALVDINSTVLGEVDFGIPFATSKKQGFYGPGSVRIASTQSASEGSGTVALGDGITLYSDGFSTVTAEAPENPIVILADSDATIGAKCDWTYGPAAGVTTATTAADRALTTAGIYANLTIDTEDPETGAGHKITFADPILAKGDVTKTGEGTLVFDTTGNTVDYCFTVEEGTLALGPTLAANTDWTGVLTAKEFAGLDECMADGFKMKIVVNDDGTSTLQMKPKVGSVLIIR